MKRFLIGFVILFACLTLCGCTEADKKDENGNKKEVFNFGEVAVVNNVSIKLNSVKKILSECLFEWDGACQSESKPDNDYFLIVDLTIENKKEEDINVSSIMCFEMKMPDGEKVNSKILLGDTVTSQLDGTVLPGELLKGQIVYDVKESDEYYFYFKEGGFSSPIKFIIKASDITE